LSVHLRCLVGDTNNFVTALSQKSFGDKKVSKCCVIVIAPSILWLFTKADNSHPQVVAAKKFLEGMNRSLSISRQTRFASICTGLRLAPILVLDTLVLRPKAVVYWMCPIHNGGDFV